MPAPKDLPVVMSQHIVEAIRDLHVKPLDRLGREVLVVKQRQ